MNKQRQAIWDKSKGHCWYCGVQLGEKGWHADHFIPIRRKMGTNECEHPELDTQENLVPACASCNRIKSTFDIEGFRIWIEGFLNSLNARVVQYQFAKRYGLVEETNKRVTFWFEENIKEFVGDDDA